jgi:hypothetical protein
MFYSPTISEFLKEHVENSKQDQAVIKFVADSPAWKFIDSDVDPTFREEGRNLRLGPSLNGLNPFPHCNTTHST